MFWEDEGRTMKKAMRRLGITIGCGLWGLGFMATAWGAESGPKILFKSQATVSGAWIQVGNVADLRGLRSSLAEEIKRLPIKEAPEPGEAAVITRREVDSALEAVPEGIRRFWDPAPLEITVVREGRLLGTEEIGRIIEGHIRKNLPGGTIQAEVREVRNFEEITLPAEARSCKVWISEPLRKGGWVRANLAFYGNGKEVRRINVSAQVELYQNAVVADRYLKRHQELRAEDLRVMPINIQQLPADAVTNPEEILGKRMLVNLNGREPLRASLLDVPPLVKKGDVVNVIVERNSLRISCLGEIKETGRKGDRVKVVNLGSKKELFGRVVDAGTVQVDVP
jgi:flagellar basal body P-ring formation protein FlgA